MALSPHMVKLLHVARAKVGMDEDTYRAMLGRYGAKSSKDRCLQPAHYHEMMGLFAQMGFVKQAKPATKAGGTKAQAREIARLCSLHGVAPERLLGIVKYVTNRDGTLADPLQFCGRRELSKVIQALRRWNWDAHKTQGESSCQNS